MVPGTSSQKITATCDAISGKLEARKLRLCSEIDAYAPAAPRDAHFSSLVEQRAELFAEPGVLPRCGRISAGGDAAHFRAHSRSLDAEVRQRLAAARHDVNT